MQSGKILIKNLNTLIVGRSSLLGSALTANLIKNNCCVHSVDKRIPKFSYKDNSDNFVQGNVADETFFRQYLNKIGPIDAFVNCAALHRC